MTICYDIDIIPYLFLLYIHTTRAGFIFAFVSTLHAYSFIEKQKQIHSD